MSLKSTSNIKKMATDNKNITFVITDTEKFSKSRKLATIDNVSTFTTL